MKDLGLQIRTSLVAIGALHQRHDQLANYFAAGLMDRTDI